MPRDATPPRSGSEAAPALPDEIADEIAESIHTLRHLFGAQQYWVLRGEPHDLTHMEGRVLSFFDRHPGATQRELVARWARDKGQVARLIAVLRARGLLEARVDDADRRSQRLFLTDEGAGVQAQVQRQRLAVAQRALAGLDGDERGALAGLLRRVRANLERE